MSDTVLKHFQSEINYIEVKINDLSHLIEQSPYHEVRLYYQKQLEIMNDMLNGLYLVSDIPRSLTKPSAPATNPYANAYSNKSREVG